MLPNFRCLGLILLLSACRDDVTQPLGPAARPQARAPEFAISDGAHNGTPHFNFLPPIVSTIPPRTGAFDGTIAPEVTVCEWTGVSCGPAVAQFTKTSGTGGQPIRVDAAKTQSYWVVWDTRRCVSGSCSLDPAKTYRLRVRVAANELGFADIDVVRTARELIAVDRTRFAPLLKDFPFLIAFRIEQGIVASVNVSPKTPTIQVGQTQQFTATLTDLHGNLLTCPVVTWTSSTPAVATVNGAGLATGVTAGSSTITAICQGVSGTSELAVRADRIAFVSNRDGNNEVYVMNGDGTGQTNLSSNLAQDLNPTWSPDRSKIAFWSLRDGHPQVYVMNADGSNQTNLSNNSFGDLSPLWSPDGSKILFDSRRNGSTEIYLMNADGSGQTNLSNHPSEDYNFAWSPNGTKIVFASMRSGTPEIYIMNADGSGQTRLTNTAASESNPIWSPDGTKIAFLSTSDLGSTHQIYVMNADGTGQTQLTTHAIENTNVAWSPDGSKIAFTSGLSGNYDVYVMNADGTGQTNLSSNLAQDLNPMWSPDGSKIAFLSSRDESGELDIYLMNPDGSEQTNLTNNPANDVQQAWRP